MTGRIAVDLAICSEKPRIRGTAITVKDILGMIAGVDSRERALEAYPELSSKDTSEALKYSC